MKAFRSDSSATSQWSSARVFIALGIASFIAVLANDCHAAISWDGGGSSNWWFDPANWSQDSFGYLPPTQDSGGTPVATDAQINVGSSPTWDITGEGVVYDPDHDPFFGAAAGRVYPTGSPLATTAGVMRDYGPQTLYRLYVSRNTTNANLITIKSGDLAIESTTIIGRSGSTADAQNLGRVNQLGGSVRLPLIALDLGNRETSGWGNGAWDYRGGTLEVSEVGGSGLRLAAGGSSGVGGTGRFIMHNPTTGGHVRAFDMSIAANGGPSGSTDPNLNPNGVTTGVGIVEFHFENGGIRPIQIDHNLSINNGLDDDMQGTRSSRLELVLDGAPTLNGGIPQNIGLFDVNFGNIFGGIITGTGDLDGDAVFNNDRVFSNADATAAYREGDTVSAIFGSTKYNWKISYSGDIAWSDADNSVVSDITGPGTGTDVVLMGLSSETIAVNNADFDGNGVVDGKDFLLWQRSQGGAGNQSQGDANSDGQVNAADLTIWKSQFGTSPSLGAVAAVPEPSSVFIAFGMLLGARASRRLGQRVAGQRS
jgi:hypothetical protein